MDIFSVIAVGILGLIFSAALSICTGLIASAIVIVRKLSQCRQQKRILIHPELEKLPYTVNYSEVEDRHGNVHGDVMIQHKQDAPEMDMTEPQRPVIEAPVIEKKKPDIKPEKDYFKPKTCTKSGSKGNFLYIFAVNRLKRQIRALKNDTEREKAEIERLLRCMRQYRGRMSGEQYEVYCAIMLTHIGYSNIILTPQTGDFGADIIAMKDGCRYCFQCKCYSLPVGVHAVQEIHSALTYYNCDIAGVITNSTFTPSAMELADKLNVMMIDDF